MPEKRLYREWRKENESVKYPFSDRATLTSRSGIVLLEGTFLDAAIHPVGGRERMYLSRVVITHDSVRVYIGDVSDPQRCWGDFDLVRPSSPVALLDAYGRPAGVLVSEANRLGIFQSWGVGTHDFTVDQTELAASVCFPTPEVGIRGVLLPDGTLLTGDVWLVGEDGVVIRSEETDIPGPCGLPLGARTIRVDIVGDPLFRRRLCEPDELFATPRFVKQIRVISAAGTFTCSPDERGNIRMFANNSLTYDTVLRLNTSGEGLVVAMVGEPVAS